MCQQDTFMLLNFREWLEGIQGNLSCLYLLSLFFLWLQSPRVPVWICDDTNTLLHVDNGVAILLKPQHASTAPKNHCYSASTSYLHLSSTWSPIPWSFFPDRNLSVPRVQIKCHFLYKNILVLLIGWILLPHPSLPSCLSDMDLSEPTARRGRMAF